jgi:hypothetical protein
MKRILIPILILMLVSIACIVGGSTTPTETPAPPPPTAEPTLAPPPTEVPQPTEALPTEAPPQQAQPTAESPAQPTAETPATSNGGGEYFSENFQGDLSKWQPFVITGNPKVTYAKVVGGRLRFELPLNGIYAYIENTANHYQDVYVEAKVEVVNGNDLGISVFCRGSDQGFYEFRIRTGGSFPGTYEVYKYDFKLKAQNKNPYFNLLKNLERVSTYDIKTGFSTNVVGMRCVGNEIHLYVNGKEQIPFKNGDIIRDDSLTQGTVGAGVMSFDSLLKQVEFSYITTKAP